MLAGEDISVSDVCSLYDFLLYVFLNSVQTIDLADDIPDSVEQHVNHT